MIDAERGVPTSAEVQVEHLVALHVACVPSAARLPQSECAVLADDPLNLRAADGPAHGARATVNAAT